MAGNSQGCKFLDLPEEILQFISVHFNACEWARGPSLACLRLNQLLLPRMALHYENEEEAEKLLSFGIDRPRLSQAFLQSLEWAAKRIGSIATTLGVSFVVYENVNITEAGNTLIKALSPATRLHNLKCFELQFYSHWKNSMGAFCCWLLEHAPWLEACSLGLDAPFLATSTLVFHNLKHLELKNAFLESAWEDSCLRPAKQLPNLESLCIDENPVTHFEVVDVAGCLHLRRLAIIGALAEVVLKPDLCQVSIAPRYWGYPDLEKWLGKVCPLLGVADQITLPEVFYSSQKERPGIFEFFPCISMLKLSWPESNLSCNLSDTEESDDSNFCGQTEAYNRSLNNSMPVDGSPLVNLKVIIIMAKGNVKVCIPARLPHLEELVIMAQGRSEPSFEEPVATFAGLKTFYALGRPIAPKGLDMIRVMSSDALAGRGLVLSAVSVNRHGKEFGRQNKTCIYLRPSTARELSFGKLESTLKQLVEQCRCAACFDCLRRAGCISC